MSGASPLRDRRGWLFDIGSGGLIALGQAPFGLWPLALLGLAGLLWRIREAETGRRAASIAWRVGTGHFAVTLHWIVEPFLVDIARHGWMAPFALVFMAAGLALFWAAAGWIAARLGRGRMRQTMLFILAFGLSELARSYVLTGFPWGLIGAMWIDTPLAQMAAHFGLHGLGLITLLAVGLAVTLASEIKNRWLAGFAGVAVCAAALGSTALVGLARAPAPDPSPDAAVLRLIQPNAAQHLKWRAEMIPVFFERQVRLTQSPATGKEPDLVIWPETAIAYRLERSDTLLSIISDAAQGTPVALGAIRTTAAGPTNALAILDTTGAPAQVYDKAHLVPFGEYIPFPELAAQLGIRGLAQRAAQGFHAGPGPRLLSMGDLGLALPLICYEAIFPNFGRTESLQADWMLQITNDAWFGQFAGPQQHLVLARFRAIERGLPMARVANTGISGMIDAHGGVTASLPLGVDGALDVALPGRVPAPFYARLGDLPILFALFVAFATLLLPIRRKRD